MAMDALGQASQNKNPTESGKLRHHDLDALRAFAMLLGILLHGLLSFIPIPIWPAQDIYQNEDIYGTINSAIHGFRMPLFFMVSGYFSAMLWQRKGLKGLLGHRLKRVVVPMIVGFFIVWPMIILASITGSHFKEKVSAIKLNQVAESDTGRAIKVEAEKPSPELWESIRQGNVKRLAAFLSTQGNPNQSNGDGATLLNFAILYGNLKMIETLLESGADVNLASKDGSTPLQTAAFLGKSEIAKILLSYKADAFRRNNMMALPQDSLKAPRELTMAIVAILGLQTDYETIADGREKVIALFESQGIEVSTAKSQGAGVMAFLAKFPFWHHLWFLYYLVWILGAYAFLGWVGGRFGLSIPSFLRSTPYCWIWIIPLTALFQFYMRDNYGPDTATGILPWPPKLLYYCVFFIFGAIQLGEKAFEEKRGRFWYVWWLLAIPVFFVGHDLFESSNRESLFMQYSFFAAVYAWLMIFGFLGFFRRYFSRYQDKVRYLSDASYWLYLSHLPLIMIIQAVFSPVQWPSWIKLFLVCIFTTVPLMICYAVFVRHTFIGRMLNGPTRKGS